LSIATKHSWDGFFVFCGIDSGCKFNQNKKINCSMNWLETAQRTQNKTKQNKTENIYFIHSQHRVRQLFFWLLKWMPMFRHSILMPTAVNCIIVWIVFVVPLICCTFRHMFLLIVLFFFVSVLSIKQMTLYLVVVDSWWWQYVGVLIL